jgi:hypothetical protein
MINILGTWQTLSHSDREHNIWNWRLWDKIGKGDIPNQRVTSLDLGEDCRSGKHFQRRPIIDQWKHGCKFRLLSLHSAHLELPRRFFLHDSELDDLDASARNSPADPISPLKLHLCGHSPNRYVALLIIHESQWGPDWAERHQCILRLEWVRF